MAEDRLIRLENFKLVVEDRGLTVADLMRDVGSSYSLWSDLIAGRKSFGEKLARRIEAALKLPRGWLDAPQTAVVKQDDLVLTSEERALVLAFRENMRLMSAAKEPKKRGPALGSTRRHAEEAAHPEALIPPATPVPRKKKAP